MNRGRSSFGLAISSDTTGMRRDSRLTDVHTSVLEGDEHVDIVGLGTNGRDDGRLRCQ